MLTGEDFVSRAAMKHDMICTWLGLPTPQWPPDHYALLGLPPGENNVQVIEQHVHDRLAKVRCYQISHPEPATEAMNRLAQAFMCLTDPEAKKAYDRTLGVPAPAAKPAVAQVTAVATLPRPASRTLNDTSVPGKQIDWKAVQVPPPVRGSAPANGQAAPLEAAPPATNSTSTETAPPAPSGATPVAQPVDSDYDIALRSFEAKRGLGTAAGLYERIFYTRQLYWVWEQAGKYMGKPKRLLTRATEIKDLTQRLAEINELMEAVPPILGQPGQPGYRVVAMARLAMTGGMMQNLDPAQREALARDWVAGQVVLKAHKRFLLQELKAWRRQTWFGKGVRAARAALNDHPAWAYGSLVVVAILIFWLVQLLW
jgi:hypothetical protein